jgi:hypothetical protein
MFAPVNHPIHHRMRDSVLLSAVFGPMRQKLSESSKVKRNCGAARQAAGSLSFRRCASLSGMGGDLWFPTSTPVLTTVLHFRGLRRALYRVNSQVLRTTSVLRGMLTITEIDQPPVDSHSTRTVTGSDFPNKLRSVHLNILKGSVSSRASFLLLFLS